jgi:hypothetical protein
MPKNPIRIEEKVALMPATRVKPKYPFWPVTFRSVTAPEAVNVTFGDAADSEEFQVKASLVSLSVQGLSLPNAFCLEFDKPVSTLRKESAAFDNAITSFSTLGNTSNLILETSKFSVVCYRPVCVSADQRYANFFFKQGPDVWTV